MIQNYSEIKSLLDRIFAILDEESRRSAQKIQEMEKRIEALEEMLRNAETHAVGYPKVEKDENMASMGIPTDDVQGSIIEVEDNFWSDDDPADEAEPLWMVDMPGVPVENVRDAILFNDRMNFINELFDDDDEQYELTLDRINEAGSFREVVSEIRDAFDWNEESDAVYRFYMAVRRKFE